MAEGNVETFMRAVDAFARDDIDAALAFYDPDVEWHTDLAGLPAGTRIYRGHAGVRELHREIQETFAAFDLVFREFRDFGDRLLAVGEIHARGRESGADLVSPIAYIIEGDEGIAKRVRAYRDPAEAFADLGLSE